MIEINSFTIDGYSLASLGVYIGGDNYIMCEDDLISDVNNYIESVAGKDGIYYYGQNFKERNIKIPCFVEGITETEKLAIQTLLTITTPKQLMFDNLTYKQILVKSNGTTTFKFKMIDSLYYGTFELNLLTINPYFESYYSAFDYEDNPYYITHENSIYEYFDILPESVPTVIYTSVTSAFTFELFNHGNVNTKVVTYITGTCTNMSILNYTTNQSITISTLSGGESLVIDSKLGQVRINDVLASSRASGTFIDLAPGTNDLAITCTAINLSLLKFVYKYNYL